MNGSAEAYDNSPGGRRPQHYEDAGNFTNSTAPMRRGTLLGPPRNGWPLLPATLGRFRWTPCASFNGGAMRETEEGVRVSDPGSLRKEEQR